MKSQEKLISLLKEKQDSLSERDSLQNKSFAISELQDTKPSALLYQLGNNVRKEDLKFQNYNNQEALALDSLCKIFAISHPYSAISVANETLYISLSQTNTINVDEIIEATSNLVNSDLRGDSCIPQVAKFYEVLYKAGNQYVQEIIRTKNIECKKNYIKEDVYSYAAKDVGIFFYYFTQDDIKNIEQKLDEIKDYKQIIPQKDEQHIHVELNLIVRVLEENPNVQDVVLGLASSNIYDKVGCCAYCSITFDVITEIEPFDINRSKDFPGNIPYSNWDFPYKLINTLEKSYLFFTKLYKQY